MPRRVYTTLSERIEAFRRTDVYPVVTSGFCAGRSPVEVAASLLAGGARILQIREKTMPDRPFLELLRQVRELTRDCGALLIVDDRVDAALIAQADGVHLGQEDIPLPDARHVLPVQQHPAARGTVESRQDVQKGGLAGPAFAHDGHELPRLHGEAHVFERLHPGPAQAGGVDLPQILDFQQGHAFFLRSRLMGVRLVILRAHGPGIGPK